MYRTRYIRRNARNGTAGSGRRAEKVPTIPCDVDEHTDSPVELVAWLADELDPVLAQSPVCSIEVLDAKEQPDTPGVLPTNGGQLIIRVGLDGQ